MEPRYIEDPFEDGATEFGVKRPKWMTPGSEFEKRVLAALGMRYYPRKEVGGKEMRSRLIEVSRSLVSLESGLVADLPMEWVLSVLEWAAFVKKLRGHQGLHAFLSALTDTEWRDRFVEKWQKEHHTSGYQEAAIDTHKDFAKYLELPDD